MAKPYSMNLNHVFFKVGRRFSNELYSFYVFLNPHALGHTKSVTVFFISSDLGQQVPQHDVLFCFVLSHVPGDRR
jgi:hypothetical protein